jgi:hypothetical protein
MTHAQLRPSSARLSLRSVRHPLSTAERSVRQTLISQAAHVLPRAFKASRPGDGQHPALPISAFAYRRVAHETSFCFARAALNASGTRAISKAYERLATYAARALHGRDHQPASRSIPPSAEHCSRSLPPVLMAGGVSIWNCA